MTPRKKTRLLSVAVVALMCLQILTLSTVSAADRTTASGYITSTDKTANFDYTKNDLQTKIVTEGDGERDFLLTLTATGYDWTVVDSQNIYAIFVIDTTSSMNAGDIPSGSGDNWKRFQTAKESAKAYAEAFFADTPENVNKHLAIVSYGANARLHVWEGYEGAGSDLVKTQPGTRTQDASLTDNFFAPRAAENEGRMSEQNTFAKYNTLIADADKYYAAFKTAMAGNANHIFMNDVETAKTVIDNMITYSDTNVESGLLMADFLIDNLAGLKEEDPVHVFLITDGEANSSSTLISYETNPVLTDWITKDETLKVNGLLSFAKVMERAAQLANDPAFVEAVTMGTYDETYKNVNFFLGNYHNLDRQTVTDYNNSRAKLTLETVINAITGSTTLAAQGDMTLEAYYAAIDAAMVGSDIAKSNELITAFAAKMLLTSQIRTDWFYTGGGGEDWYYGEPIFGPVDKTIFKEAYNAFQFYPFGREFTKDDGLSMYDYFEHSSSRNVTGSDSAKKFMNNIADIIDDRASTTLYATGIGSDLRVPEKLEPVATTGDYFYVCAKDEEILNNAAALKDHFSALGYKTSLSSVENVTITDYIPRRSEGAPVAGDGTFTIIDATKITAFVHYFDEDGNPATLEVTLPVEGTCIETDYNGAAAYKVVFNAGNVYSQAVAMEKKSADYPYMVELRIPITANEGVVAGRQNHIDIDTNLFANITWDDPNGDGELVYPVPKVYFDPPETPTEPPTQPDEPEEPTEPEEEIPEPSVPTTELPTQPTQPEEIVEIPDEPFEELPTGPEPEEEIDPNDALAELPDTGGLGVLPLFILGGGMVGSGLLLRPSKKSRR